MMRFLQNDHSRDWRVSNSHNKLKKPYKLKVNFSKELFLNQLLIVTTVNVDSSAPESRAFAIVR